MAIGNTRVPYLLAAFGCLLLLATFLKHYHGVPESWRPRFGGNTGQPLSNDEARPSFYDVALSHGSSKVINHHYHHMYQKYLAPYEDEPLKMLEIGLGCDMADGPGTSYHTWLEYLPYVDLYFIESDEACAGKWANTTTGANVFTGDQADGRTLDHFIQQAGTDFDVIIDAGGHRMEQQMTSLEALWRTVAPGGIYFCEDLQTSYQEEFGGDSSNSGKKETMMGMVKELIDDLQVGLGGHKRRHEISIDMASIDCMGEVCAFVKNEAR